MHTAEVLDIGEVEEVVRGVAAHGLATRARLPGSPLDDAVWDAVLRRCAEERLIGHLHGAVQDGALPATDAQRAAAAEHFRRTTAVGLHLDAVAVRAATALERAGVDHRLLKGPALATRYPDPARRLAQDVDLLVGADALPAAVAALAACGHTRRAPEPRPGFDRRFAKSVTMLSPEGFEVDLHRALAPGPLAFWLRLDALWRSPTEVRVAGAVLPTLPPEGLVVAAGVAAAVADQPPRLSAQRDLVQLVVGGAADPAAVVALARACRASLLVATGLLGAWERLAVAGTHPLLDWAAGYEPSDAERRVLADQRRAKGSFATEALRAVRYVPGHADKARYLLAAAVPSRELLASEGETRLSWLARGARRLVAAARR